MAGANIQTFTDANFDAEVIKSNVPVLVDFWAEWCMPCRMLTPTIEALGEQFVGKAKIGKVDTDANRKISVQFGITAIPTVILFKDGQIAKKFVGLTRKEDLAAAITQLTA
ncbi:MAG: thioredoxin [Phycisphaerales bacterium]|nr:thioredoxin [Phycisphaerales bacterium]